MHTPEDVTTKALFQQVVLTIYESQKTSTHDSQHIFRTFDPTSSQQQEKRRTKKEKAAQCFWLKVPWQREELQTLGLHALLNSKEIQDIYPVASENGNVKVSYSLGIPNGVLIQNYGKVSREADVLGDLPPEVPSPETCSCNAYRTQHSINFHGHVATVDPGAGGGEIMRSA